MERQQYGEALRVLDVIDEIYCNYEGAFDDDNGLIFYWLIEGFEKTFFNNNGHFFYDDLSEETFEYNRLQAYKELAEIAYKEGIYERDLETSSGMRG